MKRTIPSEISVLMKFFASGLVLFLLMRLGFFAANSSLSQGTPLPVLLKSFAIGMRFDAIIMSYLLLLPAFWILLPVIGWQYNRNFSALVFWFFVVTGGIIIFLCLAEWEFYREFHDRFNHLAIQYLFDDPATVSNMIWAGYPVVRYLAIWLACLAAVGLMLRSALKKTGLPLPFSWRYHITRTIPAGIVLFVLLIFGTRGGFQRGAPLRWGDAYFSDHLFANHLALNGIFTLGRSAIERKRIEIAGHWKDNLPRENAISYARGLVVQEGDELVDPGEYPVLRYPGNSRRSVSLPAKPRNLVIILMESFNAELTGAVGAPYKATPFFDNLAAKGILFDRFLSQGTHTHQGLFVSITGFPNLPGFEYLMQNNLGQQPFRSFVSIFREEGFSTLYVYNGSFTWDNQEGFFRNQGMEHFVGRDDFENPKHVDSTWGVSDEDMFMKSVNEIGKYSAEGPVFALLQTLSNHPPFELPPPAPFSGLEGPDNLLLHLDGMRYSDWALEQFFARAQREPWFDSTLFVILGDHGFVFDSPETEMDLPSYHVPLLFYFPGDNEHAGLRIHTVCSQVDLLPTVMGLMQVRRTNQSWGRDIFRIGDGDRGWAVIKPSGSRQIVGFVKDDILSVLSPGKGASVYHYRLNPWHAEKFQLSGSDLNRFTSPFYGYIQAALSALQERRAGYSATHVKRKS